MLLVVPEPPLFPRIQLPVVVALAAGERHGAFGHHQRVGGAVEHFFEGRIKLGGNAARLILILAQHPIAGIRPVPGRTSDPEGVVLAVEGERLRVPVSQVGPHDPVIVGRIIVDSVGPLAAVAAAARRTVRVRSGRTVQDGNLHISDRQVCGGIVALVEVVKLVDIGLVHLRENENQPGRAFEKPARAEVVRGRAGVFLGTGREMAVDFVEVVQSDAELLEVVFAGRPPGRFPRLLNSRQEQGDQDCNDGNHHQQLDQGESSSLTPSGARSFCSH